MAAEPKNQATEAEDLLRDSALQALIAKIQSMTAAELAEFIDRASPGSNPPAC